MFKKILFIYIFLIATASISYSQVLIGYSSSNNSGCSGVGQSNPNVIGTGICRSSGISQDGGANYTSEGWEAPNSIEPTDYLEWTVQGVGGRILDLQNLRIRYTREGATFNGGPRDLEIQVNYGGGFATIYTDDNVPTNTTTRNIDISTIIPNTPNEIVFRLYAYNTNFASGDFIIEPIFANIGIIIYGTVGILDADGDTIDDAVDNCPTTPNTDQADGDFDGIGDVCDNCIAVGNALQEDTDNDGIGNSCDATPNGPLACSDTLDFGNIQFPNTSPQQITDVESFNVFAQVFEPGITNLTGQGAGVEVWIGYSTTNTNPNTWTEWIPASFNGDRDGLTPGDLANDEYQVDLGAVITTPGTYYYSSRFSLNGCQYTYGGTGGNWNNDSVQLNVIADLVDFCNVQSPKTASITQGSNFEVYARVFEPGETPGNSANISAWIGYNTISENYLPENENNWTWIPATYNASFGNDDEYVAEIGSSLPNGTYYFASRWQLNGSQFTYGGIQSNGVGNFWDTTNNSGTLLVGNPTTLAAGDIAITGFNADENLGNGDEKGFSFVLLTDINAGTQIKFTDNGWQTSGSFRTGEGVIFWTAANDMQCGEQVIIRGKDSNISSNVGSVITSPANFNLSASGDQVLAYQGLDAAPTFIYAINFGAASWTNASSPNNSGIPSGLINGLNAVAVGNNDNGSHNCTNNEGPSIILNSVSNSSNWNTSNSLPFEIGTCDYSCGGNCSLVTVWNGSSWSPFQPADNISVTLSGNYTTSTTTPSFEACNLILTAGARLTVTDGFYVKVINDVTITDGEITTETQGSFVQQGDGTTAGTFTVISGDSFVNKTTSPLTNWYDVTYWSSPVENESTDGALFPSNRVFWFNSSNYLDSDGDGLDDDENAWTREQGDYPMTPGQGFAGSHNEVMFTSGQGYNYVFDGPYNTGDIAYPINYDATNGLHWNLIGNPYPSAIDIDKFFAENGNNGSQIVFEAIYMWSQVNPVDEANPGNEVLNYNQNDYITVNTIGEAGNGTTAAPSRQVPSGQAFFIPSRNSGNAVFKNSMRVSGDNANDAFFRNNSPSQNTSNNSIERLHVNLSSDIGIYSQICIAYADIATDGYDGNAIDTNRNYAGNAGLLYSMDNNGDGFYVIQGKAKTSLNQNEVIKLGFGAYISTNETYTLEAIGREGDFNF